jgi:hypothetical protein
MAGAYFGGCHTSGGYPISKAKLSSRGAAGDDAISIFIDKNTLIKADAISEIKKIFVVGVCPPAPTSLYIRACPDRDYIGVMQLFCQVVLARSYDPYGV